MKRFLPTALLFLALTAPVIAQKPALTEEQQLAALAAQIKAQQTALADNQAKIDAKLVTIAEAVRIARIFASRSGR
jgi:hypothetical protein